MKTRPHRRPHSRAARLATLALALGGLWLAVPLGCGPSKPQLPLPGPVPPHVTFAGRWESNYGVMELTQHGETVEGTFEYRDGRLRGTATGDLLVFQWEQPGNMTEARMAVHGRGWLRVAPDGASLGGLWGYDEAHQGGGRWTATRAQR